MKQSYYSFPSQKIMVSQYLCPLGKALPACLDVYEWPSELMQSEFDISTNPADVHSSHNCKSDSSLNPIYKTL